MSKISEFHFSSIKTLTKNNNFAVSQGSVSVSFGVAMPAEAGMTIYSQR